VELKDDEEYKTEKNGRGVRVLSQGKVVWEVSATTVIADEVSVTDVAELDLGVTVGCFCTVPIPKATIIFGSIVLFTAILTIGLCFNDKEKENGLPYFRTVCGTLACWEWAGE